MHHVVMHQRDGTLTQGSRKLLLPEEGRQRPGVVGRGAVRQVASARPIFSEAQPEAVVCLSIFNILSVKIQTKNVDDNVLKSSTR